jgi:hypothetical protein
MRLRSGRLLIHEKPDTYCPQGEVHPDGNHVRGAHLCPWLIPGPEAHWAKVAFEKYFLATWRRGFV